MCVIRSDEMTQIQATESACTNKASYIADAGILKVELLRNVVGDATDIRVTTATKTQHSIYICQRKASASQWESMVLLRPAHHLDEE